MDILDRLLKHDAWTTRKLLEISAALDDKQLDRGFDIGHKTLRNTFRHVIGNMECWTDLMTSASQIRTGLAANSSISDLIQHLDQVAEELFCFARQVTDAGRLDETFVDRLDDPPKGKTFGGTIVHLATHSMHHRAQLLFMLRRLKVDNLPEGDVLGWEQSHTGE